MQFLLIFGTHLNLLRDNLDIIYHNLQRMYWGVDFIDFIGVNRIYTPVHPLQIMIYNVQIISEEVQMSSEN